MRPARLFLSVLLIGASHFCKAQTDSALQQLQQVPLKYIQQADSKIDKYTNRITNKTEKTLTKLSKWENKIHNLLLKVNPEAAQRLFSNNQLTFAAALEKYKKGEAIVTQQKAKYDEYRDKLTTSIMYLQDSSNAKLLNPKLLNASKNAKQKAEELDKQEANTEAMTQFIKERRKQLINQSLQYIGNSKYLQKISKENYYYVETLRNYKELFHDKRKAEETALTILNKIPAFTKFIQQNGMLAKLFGSPGSGSPLGAGGLGLAGLQTRASVNALIQNQIAAGGPNAAAQIRQNIEAAQAELNKIKDKVLNSASGAGGDMPDFKPNEQKTKTFWQRLELGNNFQFSKTNALMPTTADLGLSLGYKLNTKSVIGIGASYKMGLGSIQHISITNQGIGLRSYVDWQLKKQFYLSGGYEMNYLSKLIIAPVSSPNSTVGAGGQNWQNAGLIGLSKKLNIKTKWTKGTKLSLLYDMLYREHTPISQPVVFRMGYNF